MKLRPELASKYFLDYCPGECRDLDGCGDGDVVSNGVGSSVLVFVVVPNLKLFKVNLKGQFLKSKV